MPTDDAQSTHRVTEADVEQAERRAREARDRAIQTGLSAAASFEESARRHDEVARVQEEAVSRGLRGESVHRTSSVRHRQAAREDRALAKRKREQSGGGQPPPA